MRITDGMLIAMVGVVAMWAWLVTTLIKDAVTVGFLLFLAGLLLGVLVASWKLTTFHDGGADENVRRTGIVDCSWTRAVGVDGV